VQVLTAIAAFPGEPFAFPRQLVERHYRDLRRWTDMAAGGHLGALEQPALLARDMREFFAEL
jgi:microsomal epoxide hydrolase